MANEFKVKNGVIAPALQLTGTSAIPPAIATSGTDSNIGIAIDTKGTGAIDLAAGSSGINISNGTTITAITRTSGGSGYTTAPTITISAPTTSGGVQATATCTITGGVVDSTITITDAGSGYVEQPTITFSGDGSGASAYATVGSGTIIRGLGSTGTQTLSFYTPSGEVLRIRDQGTTGSYALLQATATGVGFGAQSNAALTLYSSGTNYISFDTAGTGGNSQVRITHTASAVNYLSLTGAATSGLPTISVQGSDSNIAFALQSKGNSPIVFQNSSGQRGLRIDLSGAGYNYIGMTSSAVGTPPLLGVSTQSTDTNVSLALQAKGTGAIDLVAGSSGINVSNGGTVTAVTRLTGGSGYTSALTATISAPNITGGIQAIAAAYAGAITVAVTNGGTGYTVNDVITVQGGTGIQAQTYTVTSVSAGVITGLTVGQYGQYTTLPTNPVSVTGGTGSGATLTLSSWSLISTAVTTSGSGYVEQPTVTITGTGGSGASAWATVGSAITFKTIGTSIAFRQSSGEVLKLYDYGGQTGIGIRGHLLTGVPPVVFPTPSDGSQTNISLQLASMGTGGVQLATGGSLSSTSGLFNQAIQFLTSHTASAVNYVQVTGGATGNPSSVTISAQGSDTNISTEIRSKGSSGTISFANGSGQWGFYITPTAGAANFLNARSAGSTNGPVLSSQGSDTNIPLVLQSKGTGAIDLAAGSTGINVSNGTTVTSITVTANGSSYTSPPTWTASAPTTSGGTQASGTTVVGASTSLTITSGGSGYTAGDVLTVSGGTNTQAAVITVSTVSVGVITAATVTTFGQYTAVPSNPVSVTGGTGTGATFTLTYFVRSCSITNAGSGYVEQPTVTFSGGGGSGAAAIAGVGSLPIIRSIVGAGNAANSLSIYTPSGEALRFTDPGNTAVNFLRVQGASTGAGVQVQATGTDGNISLIFGTKGTGGIGFYTNNFAQQQFNITHTASAVNYVQVTGAATTAAPTISVQGSDTNAGLNVAAKGTGSILLRTAGTVTQFAVANTASAANYLQATGGVATAAPILSAQGSDTNVSLALRSKGTGGVDLAAGSTGVSISNGTTVTAITRTSPGTGYTSAPTVAISAPTTSGVQATATCSIGALSITIVSGGTGYTAGDTLTVNGGTFVTSAAVITVTTVSGGVITAATILDTGYLIAPTNAVNVTGGTGSGATFSITWGVRVFTITNAGSGYVEQPTITFSGGGGSGAAAYATVGGTPIIRTVAGALAFYSPSGPVAQFVASSGTAVNQVNFVGAVTGGAPAVYSSGGDTNVGINYSSKGTGNNNFYTNTFGQLQLQVSHTASAVNYVQVTGAATTASPVISAQGSDTNVGFIFQAKSNNVSNAYRFTAGGAQLDIFRIQTVASGTQATYLQAAANVSGSAPILSAQGSDTNIDLTLTPKGTGRVVVSGGLTLTGYTFPTTSGSNGQVLTTDGASTLSWSTVPGSSAVLVAGEALTAGNLVNVYSDAGAFKVRKAIATTSGYEAHGYISANVSSGANATVFFSGIITGLTGLTPGFVYLSTTGGAVTSTAPTGSGQTVHRVGVAVSSTSVAFEPGEPILLA